MKNATRGRTLVMGLLLTTLARGGVITLSPALTTDASTGISPSVSYTHRVSGGQTSAVNGVSFDVLDPASTPPAFTWDTASWTKSEVENNNNNWVPATGGVTGAGVIDLLGDFAYSGTGANPGNYQTFNLSGLTIGGKYEARLYIRPWDQGGNGRQISLTYTHGAEVDTRTIWEDRPNLEGLPSSHSAYYVNYAFTAQAPTLSIQAMVPASAPANSGSFHLYALTNQLAADATPPTGGTGPGGLARTDVSSGLLYWLDASKGITLNGATASAWADQSSRGNNFANATATQQPVFQASGLGGNSLPSLRFDGTDDYLILNTATYPQTVIAVTNVNQYISLGGLWGSSNPSDKGIRLNSATNYRGPGSGADGNDFPGTTVGNVRVNGAVTTAYTVGTPHILTETRGYATTTLTNTRIGGYYGGRYYSGDVGEVIVYDRVLNLAERQIVENYLSAKYDVPLAAGDVYSGDTPAKGNHDLDVFGIGRVNAANQVLLAGAAGFGILALNGTLGDGEWVLAGHRTPVNSDIGGRWGRDWYVDKTGALDAMLTFDFSDGGLPLPGTVQGTLLYSANGVSFAPLSLIGLVSGDQISFIVPDAMLQSGYYTLATEPIPEPGTLVLVAGGLLAVATRRRRRR